MAEGVEREREKKVDAAVNGVYLLYFGARFGLPEAKAKSFHTFAPLLVTGMTI